MDTGTIIGIVLGVISIGVGVYFGISHITKKNNKNNIKIHKSFNPKATKNLLSIASEFSISNQDVDDFMLLRLSHVEHLDQIQKKQIIDKKFENVPAGIELDGRENIVWEFNDVAKTEQQRYSQDKQWTVARSVLNNILMKKRYKELAVIVNESGTLLVTNQGLYYKDKDVITQTRFSQIHSVTPMRNGVRIQANITGAMPDTYITGDGRFTYALLNYAQGFKCLMY